MNLTTNNGENERVATRQQRSQLKGPPVDYFEVWRRLVTEGCAGKLKKMEALVFIVLMTYRDSKTGTAFAAIDHFAALLNTWRSQISKALTGLVTLGVIRVKDKGGRRGGRGKSAMYEVGVFGNRNDFSSVKTDENLSPKRRHSVSKPTTNCSQTDDNLRSLPNHKQTKNQNTNQQAGGGSFSGGSNSGEEELDDEETLLAEFSAWGVKEWIVRQLIDRDGLTRANEVYHHLAGRFESRDEKPDGIKKWDAFAASLCKPGAFDVQLERERQHKKKSSKRKNRDDGYDESGYADTPSLTPEERAADEAERQRRYATAVAPVDDSRAADFVSDGEYQRQRERMDKLRRKESAMFRR